MYFGCAKIMVEHVRQRVVEWLNEIFEEKGLKNLEFEFPDIDTSGGSIADIVFVDLTGVQDGNNRRKYSLLVKKSKDDKKALDTLDLRREYASEIEFYSKTIPIFRELAKEKTYTQFNIIPECYGTIERGDQFAIILENLKAKNFRVHDIEKPNDLDHLKLVLEAYAKWHALNFTIKEQKPEIFETFGRNMRGFDNSTKFPILVKTVEREIDFVIGVYQNKNKPHIIEKLNNLKMKVEEDCRKCFSGEDEEYSVLRHGDCWNNNFLFHYNEKDGRPDQVVVIDWQMGLRGSPLADVAQFIFYCSSRKELEHLDELLKGYHRTLSVHLRTLGCDPEKCFPWKACQEAFKRWAPLSIAGMTVSVRMSFKMEPEKSYDITKCLEVGDFSGVFGEGVKNPDEYFERIDGILELCVNKGYI